MPEKNFVSKNHQSTTRDYLARVNNIEMPKFKAAELAKQWGFHYWDGDRSINYGGHHYKPGYWKWTVENLISEYGLNSSSRVLDIGCGKGFLLKELLDLIPEIEIVGLDISRYAIENCHPDLVKNLKVGNANALPFDDKEFDLAISINTFHNLHNFDLYSALTEITRVSQNQFICVESYRNELEKMNLLYWQVTCEAFNNPSEWKWWFDLTGYKGDYEFIYFE